MSNERTKLLARAKRLEIAVSKFWSNSKLVSEIKRHTKRASTGRSDAMKRAWVSRKALFGPSGLKAHATV